MPVQVLHPRRAIVSSAGRVLGESPRGRPGETHPRGRSRLGGGGVVRPVAPALPPAAAEDARLARREGAGIERDDRARPPRRAAYRGALGGGPLLRPRPPAGPG